MNKEAEAESVHYSIVSEHEDFYHDFNAPGKMGFFYLVVIHIIKNNIIMLVTLTKIDFYLF